MSRTLAALYHELAGICTASLTRQGAKYRAHQRESLTTGLVALRSDACSPSTAVEHPALQKKQRRSLAGLHIGAQAVATATANAARSVSRRSPPLDSLTHIRRRFGAASRDHDVVRMQILLAVLLDTGAAVEAWMCRDLIQAVSLRHGADAAFAAAEELERQGCAFDGSVYYALLQTCLQAQRPPYSLDARHAERALRVFRRAQATDGVDLGEAMWGSLLDCQARAVQPDAARKTLAEAKAWGLEPSLRLYNLVVIAHARAGRAADAEAFVHGEMAADRVAPDLVTWNSILAAFAGGRDVDAAYRVWQSMQRAGVKPDQITQMHLSQAFASNPNLATELVTEAAQLASDGNSAPQGCGAGGHEEVELQYAPRLRQQLQQPLARSPQNASQIEPRTEMPSHRLDLHGMSVPTARVAILQWLEHVAAWTRQGGQLPVKLRSFVIVTGKGLRSHPRFGGVLADTAAEVLRRRQLPFTVAAGNAGQLQIVASDMVAWVTGEAERAGKASLIYRIGLRYITIFGTIGSVVAATVLVPELMSGWL